MQEVDRLGWAASSTFHIGEWHIGVRSSDLATDGLLRRALAAHLVEGVEAPPNFSVLLPENGQRGAVGRGVNMLYRSSSVAVRSRSRARIVYGLAAYLSSFVEDADGLLQTSAVAVVGDGRALLLPRQVLFSLKLFQPRLHRAGLQFVDVPVASIDPISAELVVSPPAVVVDERALSGVDEGRSAGSEPPRVSPGRYPLQAWAFRGEPDAVGLTSRAQGVAATMPLVDSGGFGLQGALDALAALFRSTIPVAVSFSKPQELMDQLRVAVPIG